MKIGVFHPALNLYGGAEVVAVVVANTLAQNGYKTEMLVNRMVDQKKIEEMVGEQLHPSIKVVVSRSFLQPRGMFHLYESAIRSLSFKLRCNILIDIYSCFVFPWIDVSYMHFPYLNNYEYNPRFPYVKTPHVRYILTIPYATLEKNLEKYSDKLILANSQFTARAIKDSLKADSEVLYPPIPSIFYEEPINREKDNLIVTTARFGQGKGVELVPEIAHLTERGLNFVMIGLAHDQNIVNYVKKRIRKLRLENRVKIITDASREDIKHYLAKAKIYLHTTQMEHFGISIAEAMAMGCIPVVHDSGGAPEFVPAKYRYSDEQEAAEKIENAAITWTAHEGDEMRRIAERFSESSFSKRFLELFLRYIELKETMQD